MCKPVYETKTKEICYTVCKPVYETKTREICYTVCKPVYETCEREVCYTVCKPVHYTRNGEGLLRPLGHASDRMPGPGRHQVLPGAWLLVVGSLLLPLHLSPRLLQADPVPMPADEGVQAGLGS